MIYLHSFSFPNEVKEFDFFMNIKRTCYDTFYPFQLFSRRGLETLVFDAVTIIYGGNGSGKSTVLNVMAEKLGLERESKFNQSNFFPDYVELCDIELHRAVPEQSRIITSDDVFDYMLNIRNINEGIDEKREELFTEYLDLKYSRFQLRSLDDYKQLKRVVEARRKSQSRFVRSELKENVREYSNGESAFMYFTEKIDENGLYLLDEPENSLSPQRQLEFVQFLEDSARFFGCQFIISTHSPFLLSMKGAKIYNLDENPVAVRRWTELENVRTYYEFFKKHEDIFEV